MVLLSSLPESVNEFRGWSLSQKSVLVFARHHRLLLLSLTDVVLVIFVVGVLKGCHCHQPELF